jgi:hypothetical protein
MAGSVAYGFELRITKRLKQGIVDVDTLSLFTTSLVKLNDVSAIAPGDKSRQLANATNYLKRKIDFILKELTSDNTIGKS